MSGKHMAAPREQHPRQQLQSWPLWMKLIPVLLLVATFSGIIYQYMNLQRLQCEIQDMRDEIGKLQQEARLELQEEEIVEFEGSFQLMDDGIPNIQAENLPDQLRFQELAHHMRQRRAVREELPRNLKAKEGRHHHRRQHTKDSPYCMHFALDDEAVKRNQDLPCDEMLQREDIRGMDLVCGVNKLSFWKNQMPEIAEPQQSDDESELIVEKAGVYYVYAQLTFHDEVLNAVYQIRREGADGEVSVLTECSGLEPFPLVDEHEKEVPSHTVFNQCHTELAVRLNPYDRIYIENMRNTTVIRTPPQLTFWGLFMLDP